VYESVGNFENGFARVKLGDKLGLMNSSGKLVLQAGYNNLGSVFKNNLVGIRPAGVNVYSLR